MKKLATYGFVVIGIVSFLALNFSSCVNKDPTVGNIRVLDTLGIPVEGADVLLYCTEALCILEDSGITDVQGKTSHEFDLPAVLKILVSKEYCWEYDTIFLPDTQPPFAIDTFVDTTVCRLFVGEGFITLEEHEEVDEDVVLFGGRPIF